MSAHDDARSGRPSGEAETPSAVAMSPAAATLATYVNVDEILRTVAYAEVRAIMLAWAGGPPRAPTDLVRAAIDHALADGKVLWHPGPQAFGQHLRGLIRTETAGTLFRLARRAEVLPSGNLAAGQHGDVPGLEVIFHHAGEAAGAVRASEARTLSTAVTLTDYVRSRLERAPRL